MVRPSDECERSSPLQGHSSWLMCEVALIAPGTKLMFGHFVITNGRKIVAATHTPTSLCALFGGVSRAQVYPPPPFCFAWK